MTLIINSLVAQEPSVDPDASKITVTPSTVREAATSVGALFGRRSDLEGIYEGCVRTSPAPSPAARCVAVFCSTLHGPADDARRAPGVWARDQPHCVRNIDTRARRGFFSSGTFTARYLLGIVSREFLVSFPKRGNGLLPPPLSPVKSVSWGNKMTRCMQSFQVNEPLKVMAWTEGDLSTHRKSLRLAPFPRVAARCGSRCPDPGVDERKSSFVFQ
jgi:hypothetical protein